MQSSPHASGRQFGEVQILNLDSRNHCYFVRKCPFIPCLFGPIRDFVCDIMLCHMRDAVHHEGLLPSMYAFFSVLLSLLEYSTQQQSLNAISQAAQRGMCCPPTVHLPSTAVKTKVQCSGKRRRR